MMKVAKMLDGGVDWLDGWTLLFTDDEIFVMPSLPAG